MSFPERLHKTLLASQCPMNGSLICPYCGCYAERDPSNPDSDTSRLIAFNKLDIKPGSRACKSVFYQVAGINYAACISLYGYLRLKEGLVEVAHSKFDSCVCTNCSENFRIVLPLIEIPSPYMSEFSIGPCLYWILRQRS